jgi:hypothetical protein
MAAVSILKNKSVVTAFVLGIVFAIFIGHAYMVYQTRALAIQNSSDIAAIAAFLRGETGQGSVSTPVNQGSVDEE